MKCKKCGARLGKFQYCQNCGTSKDYVPPKNERVKKRSVIGIILSIFFTLITAVMLTLTLSVREIFEKSLPDALDNIKWSEIEIGRVMDGFDSHTTLTQYIASFIDDPRMSDEGIAVILNSDEMTGFIRKISDNYNDVIFNKGEFMELSPQDIVAVVKANEAEITSVTSMPFSSIGDIIYNDIDKTLSAPVAEYNDTMGDLFTGLSVQIIRFMFSNAGIITGFALLLIFAVISAVSFKRAGNGFKACGITIIIPSFTIFMTALLSAVVIKIPVLAELMPSIKGILMQYGLIFTGFGVLEIVIGLIMISAANGINSLKSKKESPKQLEHEDIINNYDEMYSSTENEKIPVPAVSTEKSDSFSATGKIPDISKAVSDKNKICSVCGHINNANAKFCRNCSSKF